VLDPIPTWLLKDCSDVLSPFLAALCNSSLQTGVVSALFKTEVITSLLKKPGMDINTAHSYRAVSNLSFVSKLLERRRSNSHSQTCTHYCRTVSLHIDADSRQKRHLFVTVSSDLDSSADSQAVLTLLDMTAVFDTVDHSILLQQRLQRSYGISGNPLAWFTSYLAAREQSVRSQDKQSPQLSCSSRGSARIRLRTTSVHSVRRRCSQNSQEGSHFYADDAQLYLTCRRDDSATCASRVSTCIE